MALPCRPYDCLYDVSYSVSGARDHYREQTRTCGFTIEKVPEYDNYFCDLQHYPNATFRFKGSDKLPGTVSREFHSTMASGSEKLQRSEAAQVEGGQRYKFYSRPLYAPHMLNVVNARQTQKLTVAHEQEQEEEPSTKTVAVQSMYRESESQTIPYDAEYYIPQDPNEKQQYLSRRFHCQGPEVLTLKDLSFGFGLPPGKLEVDHIEKLRAKRAFEAGLPPLDNAATLLIRQKLMEKWEKNEWKTREHEIQDIQNQRLVLLRQALDVREAESDLKIEKRLEKTRMKKLQQNERKIHSINAMKVKTIRMGFQKRKYVEKPRKLQKPSIIKRYAYFASEVYAPLQRSGQFPDTKLKGLEIVTEGYIPRSLHGLVALEKSLPKHSTEIKIKNPLKKSKLTHAEKKEKEYIEKLQDISAELEQSKNTYGSGVGDCWPYPVSSLDKSGSKTIRAKLRNAERPQTPVAPPPTHNDPKHLAIILLQRLLRGRSVQNDMYEGRMMNSDLIKELMSKPRGSITDYDSTQDDMIRKRKDAQLGVFFNKMLRALAIQEESERERRVQEVLENTHLQAPVLHEDQRKKYLVKVDLLVIEQPEIDKLVSLQLTV